MSAVLAKETFKETPALESQPEPVVEKPKEAPKPKLEIAKPKTKTELEAENERLKAELEQAKGKDIEKVRAENQLRETQAQKPLAEGFKQPSIANLQHAHTQADFKKLMEIYQKQNPVKYAQKKVALEAKLRSLPTKL